jgi:hypothetical protein
MRRILLTAACLLAMVMLVVLQTSAATGPGRPDPTCHQLCVHRAQAVRRCSTSRTGVSCGSPPGMRSDDRTL